MNKRTFSDIWIEIIKTNDNPDSSASNLTIECDFTIYNHNSLSV